MPALAQTFNFWDEALTIIPMPYRSPGTRGQVALTAVSSGGEPYGTLTVALEGVVVPAGYVIIKSYSENKGVYEALCAQGFIEPAIDWISSGYVRCPVCKLIAA